MPLNESPRPSIHICQKCVISTKHSRDSRSGLSISARPVGSTFSSSNTLNADHCCFVRRFTPSIAAKGARLLAREGSTDKRSTCVLTAPIPDSSDVCVPGRGTYKVQSQQQHRRGVMHTVSPKLRATQAWLTRRETKSYRLTDLSISVISVPWAPPTFPYCRFTRGFNSFSELAAQ